MGKDVEEGRRDFQTEKQTERRNVKMKPICPRGRPETVDNVQLSFSHAFSHLYGLQHVKHIADTDIKHTDTQY